MKKKILFGAISAIVAAGSTSAFAMPSGEQMWETIQKQQAEIEQLKKQAANADRKISATADAVEQTTMGSVASKTKIGGYGEHHFNHFSHKDDQIDAHRFVVYISHDYSDKIKFFSEVELEHSLSGEGKPGEVELEQAYIQYDYTANHSIIAGQFLIPVGFLNESHEPETFYGTERNPVEKNIIPTTWWETGAMFSGIMAPGLSYDVALHSGLEVEDGGKVRGGRQKSAKAVAEDLAFTTRIKYTGVKGLTVAASLQYQQDITQGNGTDDNGEATLLVLNAAYQVDNYSLRALWSTWDIDGSTFKANGRDEQTGWMIEAGYKFNERVGVFARHNTWDNNAGSSTDTEYTQADIGVNYWLHENVAVKVDYSDVDAPTGSEDYDIINLGLGWSF
ncbi:MAG: porin [Gammaproteobacteria bacterium]|nr:MAG: porin [Gammaproteobacteria bacterium]